MKCNQDVTEANNRFVLGSRRSLSLELNVTNYGEPSYGTRLELVLPPNATLRRLGDCSVTFNPHSDGHVALYSCPVKPNPLKYKRTVRVSIFVFFFCFFFVFFFMKGSSAIGGLNLISLPRYG